MHYYDNTRVNAYKECARSYYLRHIRHWRLEGTSYALIFGLSWHSAMDVVWSLASLEKSDEELTLIAMTAFIDTWEKEGLPYPIDPEDITKYRQRTPGTAHEMIWNYIQQRRNFLATQCEVVGVERPFAVDIDTVGDIKYIGRLDKEFIFDGRILVGEHKTTSLYRKAGGFADTWIESFSNNSQIDGYNHAAHMLHGDKAKAVWVDGALVHKDVHDKFKFIPVERRLEQMDAWLWETKEWIKEIEKETEMYNADKKKESRDFLPFFKKNTSSCQSMYGPCPFFPLCRFRANPERIKEPPDKFIVEKWEPFDILGIEKLGLEKEI